MNVNQFWISAILTQTVPIPKAPTTARVRMVFMEMGTTAQVNIDMFSSNLIGGRYHQLFLITRKKILRICCFQRIIDLRQLHFSFGRNQ
jgi:hypothetical protein